MSSNIPCQFITTKLPSSLQIKSGNCITVLREQTWIKLSLSSSSQTKIPYGLICGFNRTSLYFSVFANNSSKLYNGLRSIGDACIPYITDNKGSPFINKVSKCSKVLSHQQ